MRFVKESIIRAAPERVFAFHELPDAFERLVPPWENAKIIQKADITKIGSRAVIEQKIFGLFPSRWIAEHTGYDPPREFEDVRFPDLLNRGGIGTLLSRTRRARCCATTSNSSRRSAFSARRSFRCSLRRSSKRCLPIATK